MGRSGVLGVLAGGALLGLMPLAPWPTSWPTFLLLGTAALILERSAVTLDGEFRFSAAVPIYLACGMVDSVGTAAAAALLLMETVARRPNSALPALEARSPLVLALIAMAAGRLAMPQSWWLPLILGPAAYLLGTLALEHQTRSRLERAERLRWIRARLQIRPLQFTLAASSLVAWVLAQQAPWLPLLLIPVLISSALAAENIVLKAQEMSADAVLTELEDAKGQRRKTAQKLAAVETEKQLMEGFSAHLARGPNLQETAQSLVATIKKMVETDDVVVFLSPPNSESLPEPFYYQAQDHHQARLQGLSLTGLREPIIEHCWESKKLRSQLRSDPSVDRLFDQNRASVAVPMGTAGVLYLGRKSGDEFPKTELKSLNWLAQKAELAFEAAFRNQQEQQQSERQRQQMAELTKRIALLGSLIRCAEEMAATLQLEELADRLAELLRKSVNHKEGFFIFAWDNERQVKRSWGSAAPPSDLTVLSSVEQTGKALLIKNLKGVQQAPPTPTMVSLICAPLTAQDKICGAVCLGHDRPDHFDQENLEQLRLIAYQAGMAFSNARLYNQVLEARQQLEESQRSLLQSSKMSAIGELAAGVAHELNTPLGVMSLSLEAALDTLESSPKSAKRMVGKALKAIERSQSITERLLTYSRRPSREVETMRLDQMVEETLEFLSFDISNSGLKPSTVLEPIEIQARPQEIQQILVNLIRNALQAMEDKRPEDRGLTIKVSRQPEGAVVEVADRGQGMTEQQMDRIFEPFYTTKEVGKGTGLGLWVSLQIAEQHDGLLEVSSKEGEGSRFRLILPC